MISLVYPVRLYACSGECGWTGLVPSVSGLQRRKYLFRFVVVFALLMIGAGLAIHKYGAGLKWRHHPHPSDGIEEDVSGIPEQ
jgi:hypothetical protein